MVDFPESTCPITTMLMCILSFGMATWTDLLRAEGKGERGGESEGERVREESVRLHSRMSHVH